ncbi:MAG: hypothetical protein ACTSRZ_14590 [Promethearchaeota archaeon]
MRRYVTKRAFATKCRYCGQNVLYWEAETGQKVFFNLPIYGKPIKHLCEEFLQGNKKIPLKEEKDRKRNFQIGAVSIFECPVCFKTYNSEKALNDHIRALKKIDDDHHDFFDHLLDLIDFDTKESENDSDIKFKRDNYVKTTFEFGKVTLRKRKKIKK